VLSGPNDVKEQQRRGLHSFCHALQSCVRNTLEALKVLAAFAEFAAISGIVLLVASAAYIRRLVRWVSPARSAVTGRQTAPSSRAKQRDAQYAPSGRLVPFQLFLPRHVSRAR